MPQVPSDKVLAFLQATRKLSKADQAATVGRSEPTLRRWRTEAGGSSSVAIEDDAWARMQEYMGALPPADVDAFEQGVRQAFRRAREALDRAERDLLADATKPASTRDATKSRREAELDAAEKRAAAQAQTVSPATRDEAESAKGRRRKTKPA